MVFGDRWPESTCTTRHLPLMVFEEEEKAKLLPYDGLSP
jgi:hypothetical protein